MNIAANLTAEATTTTQATIRRVVQARTESFARELAGGNLEALTDEVMIEAFQLAIIEVGERFAKDSGRTFRTAVEIIRNAFAAA